MAEAELAARPGSLHRLTLEQLSFALLFMGSRVGLHATLAAIPDRLRDFASAELNRVLTDIAPRTAVMTLDQIEQQFERESEEGEDQISMFASLSPLLRAHLANRGAVRATGWWKPLADSYAACEEASQLQRLSPKTPPALAAKQGELEMLQQKRAALKAAQIQQQSAARVNQIHRQNPAPAPASSGMDLLNLVPHLQKKAEQAEEHVGKVQADVVALEKELATVNNELKATRAQNAQLRDRQKSGLPLAAANKVDVTALALALKGAMGMRDDLQKSVAQLEAKRDMSHENCVAVADQIQEVQLALEAASAPDSHTAMLEERAREIEELSVHLQEAEELMAAHRNRRVAAARELSVREGVGAAMSLAPEQDPDSLRATWSRTQHSRSRNIGRTMGSIASLSHHVSPSNHAAAIHSGHTATKPKDEAFVRGMMKRLNETTGGNQLTREQLDGAHGDPQLAMLNFWTG